jgi:diketogulonate reductase-like aldo/keto reductase
MIELRTLSNDLVYPIGIGSWDIASRENNTGSVDHSRTGYKNVGPNYGEEPAEILGIQYSLLHGQNYLDTAGLYGAGYTNHVIGRALAGVAGSVPRERLFISHNIWKSDYGNMRAAVSAAMSRLGTDYLDAAGPHSPHTEQWSTPPWQSATPEISRLIGEGVIRGLSVSNFSAEQLEEAEGLVGHPVVTAHMGFSVIDQKRTMLRYCEDRGIQVVGYEALRRGAMSNRAVQAVARAHSVSPARVCLAYVVRLGVLPITKAVQTAHIDDNIVAPSLELTEAEMELLANQSRPLSGPH